MIKSVKSFPFSFWKIISIFFFYFIKFKPWHKHAKWPPSDLTQWTPYSMCLNEPVKVNQKMTISVLWWVFFGFKLMVLETCEIKYHFWKFGNLETRIFKPAFFPVFNLYFRVFWLLSSLPAWCSFSQLLLRYLANCWVELKPRLWSRLLFGAKSRKFMGFKPKIFSGFETNPKHFIPKKANF